MNTCADCKTDCPPAGRLDIKGCEDFSFEPEPATPTYAELRADLALLKDQYEELLAERDGFRDRYMEALRQLESLNGKVQGIRDILSVEPRR